MERLDNSLSIIDSICEKLDPLFQSHGFYIKIRKSEPSILNEIVFYGKDHIRFRISVCMHPHDYPNSLNIELIRISQGQWNHESVYDFIKEGELDNINEELFIVPQSKVDISIEKLYSIFELVLRNKRFEVI